MSACDTCAFRSGCETHDREPDNRLKALICAAAGIPFFCHHGFDWKTTDLFQIQGRFVPVGGELIGPVQVCAGWKREVAKRKKRGWFADPELNKLRRTLGTYALQLMKDFIEAQPGEAKEEHHANLRAVLEMLFGRTMEESEAA